MQICSCSMKSERRQCSSKSGKRKKGNKEDCKMKPCSILIKLKGKVAGPQEIQNLKEIGTRSCISQPKIAIRIRKISRPIKSKKKSGNMNSLSNRPSNQNKTSCISSTQSRTTSLTTTKLSTACNKPASPNKMGLGRKMRTSALCYT